MNQDYLQRIQDFVSTYGQHDSTLMAGLETNIIPPSRKVVGLDLSRNVVGNTKKLHPEWDIIRGDVRWLNMFNKDQFECLVDVFVLDHVGIPFVDRVVKEYLRVTSDTIIVIGWFAEKAEKVVLDHKGPRLFLFEYDLRELFTDAGWKLEKKEVFYESISGPVYSAGLCFRRIK